MVSNIVQMFFMLVSVVVAFTVVSSIIADTKVKLGIDNTTTIASPASSPVNTTTLPDIQNPSIQIVLLVVLLVILLIVVGVIIWRKRRKEKV